MEEFSVPLLAGCGLRGAVRRLLGRGAGQPWTSGLSLPYSVPRDVHVQHRTVHPQEPALRWLGRLPGLQ